MSRPQLNGIEYDVFFPWSEMAHTGNIDEDGREEIKLVYWVVGENNDGYRIRTINTYTEREATSKALIMNHLNNDGTLDMRLFEGIDPAYGSKAYVDNGIEHQRYLQERKDAGLE